MAALRRRRNGGSMTLAIIAYVSGFFGGVLIERHRRHWMLCRLIREEDAASMEEF